LIVGALVGVLIVALIAATAALALRDDDSPSTSASDGTTAPRATTPPNTGGSGSGGTTTTAPANDLDAAVTSAMAFVEKTRGHKFVSRPPVETLGDTDFVARYNALLDHEVAKDPTGVASQTLIYRALGIIDPDADIIEVMRSFGAEGVLGYYDPESNELVVRAGSITPYSRITLVHELTHALDDQLFELNRPQYDDAKDEVGFGLSAVAEGNARRVEDAYRASLSSQERRDADREEARYASGLSYDKFTRSFLLLQLAPYDDGEAFVKSLVDSGGEPAVDAALQDPPHTSEQVVHPDKYKANEPRVEVPAPPADGAVVESGVVGQVAIDALLNDSVDAGTASRAADGWGGDWFVAWKDGARSCVRATFVMETPNDQRQLSTAFKQWAKAHGATVSDGASDTTLTSCVG
jgi:hypothetical protein